MAMKLLIFCVCTFSLESIVILPPYKKSNMVKNRKPQNFDYDLACV